MKYSIKKSGTKNVLMILIAIMLVSGAFVFAEYRNKQVITTYSNETVIASDNDNYNKIINENDIDWKKILIANDLSSSTKKINSIKQNENLTQTDLFSRDFFTRYMELRQMGISNDKISQEDVASQVLKNGIMLSVPKTYKESDILINNNTDIESLRKYGNDAGQIFKTYVVKSRNEAIIVKDYTDKSDPKILEELDPIIKSYKNMLNGLLKVSAPTSLSNEHLNLINTMSSLVYIVEGLRKMDIDPLAGIQAVARYTETYQQFISVINNIKSKLSSTGIIYSNIDGGSFFIPNKTI